MELQFSVTHVGESPEDRARVVFQRSRDRESLQTQVLGVRPRGLRERAAAAAERSRGGRTLEESSARQSVSQGSSPVDAAVTQT